MASPDIGRRGLLLVLSSPSGAGKTTIARRLLAADDNLALSTSVTTRPPRPGEVDGADYHFIDDERFDAMIAANDLVEHAEVFGHRYGTPAVAVQDALAAGQDVLFDIDWQGAQQLTENAPGILVKVFVLPPSIKELERRLITRAQDAPEVVAQRMAGGEELIHWAEFDYVVLNHNLDETVRRITSILEAERLRPQQQLGLAEFVRWLRESR